MTPQLQGLKKQDLSCGHDLFNNLVGLNKKTGQARKKIKPMPEKGSLSIPSCIPMKPFRAPDIY